MAQPGLERFIGTVVTIAEEDYKYGIGQLRLRVERATLMRSEPGWALVSGTRVDHRGIDAGRSEVLVRVDALT
jgi:hypothetical protein